MLATAERALLERLEDEQLLERVYRRRAEGTADALQDGERADALQDGERADALQDGERALPARAAGLLAALRETTAGQEACARAQAGDMTALDALLDAPGSGSRSPRLLHHLALFHGSLAAAAQPPADTSRPGEARGRVAPAQALAAAEAAPQRHELRALDAWALLLSEGRYLAQLADRVADGALSETELRGAVEAAALERIASAGQRLSAGVEAQSEDAARALRLLHAIDTHAFPPGVSEVVMTRLRAEAGRHRRRSIDAALATLTDRFAQAETDPRGADAEHRALADAAGLYAWSQRDWYVALFTLERATGTGWSLYKAKRWDTLAKLCETLRPLVDDAAARVEADPSALPYASLVAQMLVFRAEMGKTLATRIVDGERALRLCDTHRNARVILADLLAERATVTLDSTGVLGRDAAVQTALRDIARADELWAGLPRVASLRKRIDRMSGVTR